MKKKMNLKGIIIFGLVLLTLFNAPTVEAQRRERRNQQATTPNAPVQTAPAQPSAPSAPPPNPYFTGDGGRGRSITILPPRAVGLTANQAYLPDFVANELVANFGSFTAMTLFDRVNLQQQYEELLSGYYSDDDSAGLDLGHLTSTDYMLIGNITRTTTGFGLQLTINRNSDKTTVASYSATVTIADLDNLRGIRLASLDLIQKMGITPTERTRTALSGAAEQNHVNAQINLAQGITAQRSGTVIESLSHYIQANNYDPTLAEAASRLNILTANISSGNIGENVRNDLHWRDQWVERLRECEEFFANYFKDRLPYSIVYSTNITQGTINYERRTVDLTLESIGSYPDTQWFSTAARVVNTVRDGLIATGRAEVWGLAGWPKQSINTPSPFLSDFPGFRVQVQILNSERVVIAEQIVTLPAGRFFLGFTNMAQRYGYPWEVSNHQFANAAMPVGGSRSITFPGVDPYNITDNLSIRISQIDGLPAQRAAEQRGLAILSQQEFNAAQQQQIAQAPNVLSGNLYLNSIGNYYIFSDNYYFYQGSTTGVDNNNQRVGSYNSFNVNFDNRRWRITENSIQQLDGRSETFNLQRIPRRQIPGDWIPLSLVNGSSRIGSAWSNGDWRVDIVYINPGVSSIESEAFIRLSPVTIVIPDSVRTIGSIGIISRVLNGGRLTRVIIGANVELSTDAFNSSGFQRAYNQNGRRAGTYNYIGGGRAGSNMQGGTWQFTPR